MRSALLLSLASVSLAFQLPFKVPFTFFKSTQAILKDEPVPEHGTPRIAIIGAGAGGSSAAFWLSKAKERSEIDVEIDVYEKGSYIGGRSTTVQPYDDPSLPPVELGASIFVQVNRNLWRAAQVFNLTLKDLNDEDGDTGIWDGQNLLFTMGSSWWDTLKMMWRYGLNAPRRTDSIVKSMVKDYLDLYSHDAPKWDNITTLATTLGFMDMISNTTADFFRSHDIDAKFVNEIIEAATRVNYGQNVDKIHALEGACSLATTGASQVSGGNYQIFQRFLNHSQATLHLNTQVTRITSKSSSSHPWIVHTDEGSVSYSGIILTAPFHQTKIKFPPSIASQVPEQPYVHLYVTLLTTKSPSVNPEYLSLPLSSKVPPTLLTTYQGAREGGKAPEFNSLSYHGKVKEDEWVVKIFSEERISDEWLNNVFSGQVGWIYRKEWDAYPRLPPTTAFPPVKLDAGFYYANGFETLISTMETQTIASRNVVDLLLNEVFNSSMCGSRISASESQDEKTVDDDDFVYGWDC